MSPAQLPFRVVEDVLQRKVNLFRRADGENGYDFSCSGFDYGWLSHHSASPFPIPSDWFDLVNRSSSCKPMAADGIRQHHQPVAPFGFLLFSTPAEGKRISMAPATWVCKAVRITGSLSACP